MWHGSVAMTKQCLDSRLLIIARWICLQNNIVLKTKLRYKFPRQREAAHPLLPLYDTRWKGLHSYYYTQRLEVNVLSSKHQVLFVVKLMTLFSLDVIVQSSSCNKIDNVSHIENIFNNMETHTRMHVSKPRSHTSTAIFVNENSIILCDW